MNHSGILKTVVFVKNYDTKLNQYLKLFSDVLKFSSSSVN